MLYIKIKTNPAPYSRFPPGAGLPHHTNCKMKKRIGINENKIFKISSVITRNFAKLSEEKPFF